MEVSALRNLTAPTLRTSSSARTSSGAESFSPPLDEVSLSAASPVARVRGKLGGLALMGVSVLGSLGSFVASAAAQATQVKMAAPQPQAATLKEMVSASATEGWRVSGASDTARIKVLTTPATQRGDYVRHGVNFSHLVSDAEFTDTTSTRQQDIQSYLEEVESWLADTPVDGQRYAAEVIFTTAKTYNLNPWVLLATLEKETSLVSRTAPPSHKTLRKSMGFGYDDGGSTAGKQSNFLYQLEKGAALLGDLYSEGQQMSFPCKMKVDYGKKSIVVRNAATYALIRYTPHTVDTKLARVGGGNFLFRKHMERMVRTCVRSATSLTRGL
jgi:hypothetical protein